MSATALFVFNGDPMCFIHVLLNALDMDRRGERVRIVMEGAATALVAELDRDTHPLNNLWQQARHKGLVAGVCKACASKLGTAPAAAAQQLPLLDDMKGHPSMASFRDAGYAILTF
jgi:hypothetical protein